MPDSIPELTGLPRFVRMRAHETYLLILCVVAGAGGILAPQANVLNTLLPSWFLWLWNVGLIVGAVIGLCGMLFHSPTGPLIERAGLRLLNGIGLAYAAVVLYAAGVAGLGTGLAVVLFVAFNALRVYQIRIQLAAQRAMLLALREARNPDDPGSQP
jgi:hypothetical protein